MPSVGVVSVNYQSHSELTRCLASLKKHCRGDLSFIVVDNSPVPEVDLIASEHPDIIPIVSDSNLGFAGGCNLGIAYALEHDLDYVLLLNPDTRAEHDFIAALVKELECDEKRGMAGPNIVWDDSERKIWYGGGRMNWWMAGPVQVRDNHHHPDRPALPVPFLSGCAMLMKSSAIKVVGPMPEGYFLYYEDTDYSFAFSEAGYELVYVPAAALVHAASSSVGYQSRDYVYYFSRNRIWFMRRWARWYHYLVFMAYNTLVKLPGAVIVFGLLRRQPALTASYFHGFWHGVVRNDLRKKLSFPPPEIEVH